MPKLVTHGAMLKCSEGLSPSSLTVLPLVGTDADQQPIATVMDYVPLVNIAPFGMCKTQANPQVASATAAAQGVLTPMPCVPVITAPWSPGSSNVTILGPKALTDSSKCNAPGQEASRLQIRSQAYRANRERASLIERSDGSALGAGSGLGRLS